jgi:hypothetical protein
MSSGSLSFTNADKPTAKKVSRWRNKWAIGIYVGPSPLALAPASVNQPVLTARDVTDVPGQCVADPFLLRYGGIWYLFFEVLNGAAGRGEVAYATSTDGLRWTYGAVVLREPFHLSYPQVFAWEDAIYMIPETRQDKSVRLYRAENFPGGWRCVGSLLHGWFADATILRHQDRWWLFAQRGLDELLLFSSKELTGTWEAHAANPLWPGNRHRTRPGGRMLFHEGRVLRFAQDGWPSYGSRLCVFAVDRLSESEYAEHELPESPIFTASGSGWNAVAMHHIDAVRLDDGSWLAAVDGASLGLF